MNDSPELLVIGGGSGGIACARRAAQYGAQVAVIESGHLGGTCVNVGCVPKKLMWHAGQLAHALDEAPGYGFDPVPVRHDWASLVERREAYLRRLNGIYQRNLESDAVEIIPGQARFEDPHTVSVGGRRIKARQILIATGGEPMIPEIPGAELGLSSDGFFALCERPQRVVVVGAGYIAAELAGVLRALGSEVHLVLRHDRILRHFDALLGEVLMQEMRDAGMVLHGDSGVTELRRNGELLDVALLGGQRLQADALIWAIGRRPRIQPLNLAAAGVELDARSHIVVDEWQATAQPHIFALGDVTAAPALTPVAIQAGRRLADRLYGGQADSRLDTHMLPTVVFSHPPIGTIGLSEAEARARHGDAVKVYQGWFKGLYSALLEHKTQSAVKMVVLGPEEKVIGLHSIGPGADEMMQGFAVAMRMGATKRDFDGTIAIHPSAAEELVTLR